MSRIELPKSALANFPFRLLPHFQPSAEELERTLAWESQFYKGLLWPTISLAVNSGSKFANESLKIQSCPLDDVGEFVLVMAGDTILHPSSVFIIKKQLKKYPCDLVYWDECCYNLESLNLFNYIRKGRPSPLSFVGRNVIGNTAVIRRTLWESVEHGNTTLDEKLWTISLEAKKSLHIPLALSSTNGHLFYHGEPTKDLSLQLTLKLKHIGAQIVEMKEGDYGLRSQIELAPIDSPIDSPIGIVIPFKNQAEKTIKCIEAISMQDGSSNLHLRLINNSSESEELDRVRTALMAKSFYSASIIDDDDYFNYARLNNHGIKELLGVGCTDIVLMNNDVELETENFLFQLQAWSRFPGVGLVGGTLHYPSGAIQSAGINFSQVRPANVTGGNLYADKLREVDGLCFAAVLIRDSVLNALGGLDEVECPNGYGDTLFCQKAREHGFSSLHVPWLKAVHDESASRGIRPEELELLELVQNGLPISDLWSDLEAERQPMIIPLGPASSAFQAVVRQVSSSRKLLATAEAVCKPIVKIGKGLRRQLTISKLN